MKTKWAIAITIAIAIAIAVLLAALWGAHQIDVIGILRRLHGG